MFTRVSGCVEAAVSTDILKNFSPRSGGYTPKQVIPHHFYSDTGLFLGRVNRFYPFDTAFLVCFGKWWFSSHFICSKLRKK
ncbi:hypothetical protein ACE4RR_20430 [Alteribacillus sp. HJP-4]